MKNDNPCKDCQIRSSGCHSGCPAYKKYREILDAKKQLKPEGESDYVQYLRDAIKRMKRGKRR